MVIHDNRLRGTWRLRPGTLGPALNPWLTLDADNRYRHQPITASTFYWLYHSVILCGYSRSTLTPPILVKVSKGACVHVISIGSVSLGNNSRKPHPFSWTFFARPIQCHARSFRCSLYIIPDHILMMSTGSRMQIGYIPSFNRLDSNPRTTVSARY
jgi:hypothetical protein